MLRARRYLAPLTRLTLFLAVVAGVLAWIDHRTARASVMEHLLGIGRRMAPYLDDGRGTEGPRQLHINGLRLQVAAGHTSHPPALVRRWYADRYAGRGSALDVLTEELKRQRLIPPSATALSQASFGDERQGGLAALDVGDVGSLRALAERLIHAGSGDIAQVGALRYLYYERSADGGTRFLTVWSDERFDLAQLVPGRDGDAPGRDIANVPRYPGTARVLSADERGAAGQLALYVGGGAAPELAQAFYRARMPTLGWRLDPRFEQVAEAQGRRALRCLSGDGHEVVIDCSDGHDGHGLTVTVVQLH
jgi:hypothetical protein